MIRLSAMHTHKNHAELYAVLFLAAFVVRLTLFFLALRASHARIDEYLLRVDTPSYVAIADSTIEAARPENAWHERVFPGWSLVLVPFALLGVTQYSAVVLGSLLAAIVPVLYLWHTGDKGFAWLIAFVPPTWLMHSSLGMSEPLQLAASMASIALATVSPGWSGLCMAMASLTRPQAVFAGAAILVNLFRLRKFKAAAKWVFAASLGPLALILFNIFTYKDWVHQARMYSMTPNVNDEILKSLTAFMSERNFFNLPFVSLILTPILSPTPTWKIVFVLTNVVFVLSSSIILGMRIKRDSFTAHYGIWAILNTAFIVCGGPYWGFHSFDRYAVWALPAYAYGFSLVLPQSLKKWWLLFGMILVSIVGALWGMIK